MSRYICFFLFFQCPTQSRSCARREFRISRGIVPWGAIRGKTSSRAARQITTGDTADKRAHIVFGMVNFHPPRDIIRDKELSAQRGALCAAKVAGDRARCEKRKSPRVRRFISVERTKTREETESTRRAFGNREDGKIQVIVAITGATSPPCWCVSPMARGCTHTDARAPGVVSYPPGPLWEPGQLRASIQPGFLFITN